MGDVYFGNFRAIVIRHINEINAQDPETLSTEWFLLKYLRRIEKNANPPASETNMENCIRALVRFYVDNVDEHSPLGDRCTRIYQEYRKTLRTERQE